MADLPRLDRARAAWWTIGALLGAALIFVFYSFIGTFVFAIFLYYATRPIYRRLKHRVKPPSLAAAIALFLIALPALLLVAYTVAIGLQELSNALDQYDVTTTGSLGQIETAIQPYINASSIIESDPQRLLRENDVTGIARDTFNSALGYVGFIGNTLLHLFVMIAIAFYLLRDDHRLSRWFNRRFSDDRGVLDSYVRAVDEDFNNIFFGNILNALLTSIIGATSYNVLNLLAPSSVALPYPTLLGLLTGAASLIPVVGMKLVYFPIAIYLLVEAGLTAPTAIWFAGLFFAVSFVLVDTIPDLVLRPYVSGRNLHVGMVMFAYIFGPLLFGFYGIFLGPMILVLAVHFAKLVLPELLAGQPIQPWAVDPSHMDAVQGPTSDPGAVPTDVDSDTGSAAESDSEPESESEPGEVSADTDEATPGSPTEE